MLKNWFEVCLRKIYQLMAKRFLKKNQDLWDSLQIYLAKTESTGCGYIDYAELYKAVKNSSAKEILELGSGVTTLIIAHALMENHLELGVLGRVTSMEEHRVWFNMSKKLLPEKYMPYVDFVFSKTVDDYYSIFRGVKYLNTPQRKYDFVFVDGPKYISKKDYASTFDFDFIDVLKRSVSPVSGLVDKRLSTVFVLQQILGHKKVIYCSIKGLGFILPVTKNDLGNLSKKIDTKNFMKSLRLFRRTKLGITSNVNES